MSEIFIPNFLRPKEHPKRHFIIRQAVQDSDKIIRYLKIIKEKSRRTWGCYIRDFFIAIDEDQPDDYLKETSLMENGEKVSYQKKLEQDIQIHITQLIEDEKDTKASVTLCALKGLLQFNNIEMRPYFWKHGTPASSSPARKTDFKTPTPEELKDMLKHADVEAKALFLTMMTSGGTRIGKMVDILLDDCDLDRDCPRIYIRTPKNTISMVKYISPEAKEALLDYLEIREDILKTRLSRAKGKRDGERTKKYPKLLFPMSESNGEDMWKTILKNSGYDQRDPVTKLYPYNAHCLRRYFRTYFKHTPEWAQYFMNQRTKLNRTYWDLPEKRRYEEYQKGVEGLYIFDTVIENTEAFEQWQKEREGLMDDNRALKDSIKVLTQANKSIKEKMELYDHILAVEINNHINPYQKDTKLTKKQVDERDKYVSKARRQAEKSAKKKIKDLPEDNWTIRYGKDHIPYPYNPDLKPEEILQKSILNNVSDQQIEGGLDDLWREIEPNLRLAQEFFNELERRKKQAKK